MLALVAYSHRDLKCGNVLIKSTEPKLQVKVLNKNVICCIFPCLQYSLLIVIFHYFSSLTSDAHDVLMDRIGELHIDVLITFIRIWHAVHLNLTRRS